MATFASVRTSNRAARAAEQSLLVGLRPLLVPSRLDDPVQKVGFADGKYVHVSGSGGAAESADEAVYLAISLRNAGTGLGVLHGWRFYPAELVRRDDHAPLEEFTRLTRDLYIAAGDIGFWQGAFRDPTLPEFAAAKHSVDAREPFSVELLYGDFEGGQRVVSRFAVSPRDDGGWLAAVGRHWNIDRAAPR